LNEEGWFTEVVPALFGPKYIAENERKLRVFARGRAKRPPANEGIQAQWKAYEQFDVGDQLGQISCPTLVVHGLEDALSPEVNARVLSEEIPNARLVRLKGLGHSPNVEAPQAFNKTLEPFLRHFLQA
jgi:pimeloyl-ACP methyl ester carboxylesterase